MAGKSRVNREVHARFCEGLGVKFPGPTRPGLQPSSVSANFPEADFSVVNAAHS